MPIPAGEFLLTAADRAASERLLAGVTAGRGGTWKALREVDLKNQDLIRREACALAGEAAALAEAAGGPAVESWREEATERPDLLSLERQAIVFSAQFEQGVYAGGLDGYPGEHTQSLPFAINAVNAVVPDPWRAALVGFLQACLRASPDTGIAADRSVILHPDDDELRSLEIAVRHEIDWVTLRMQHVLRRAQHFFASE